MSGTRPGSWLSARPRAVIRPGDDQPIAPEPQRGPRSDRPFGSMPTCQARGIGCIGDDVCDYCGKDMP